VTTNVLERIPELACPLCRGDLEAGEGLRCVACGASFPVTEGIPEMLGEAQRDLAEEIAVQDRVAIEYESKRYRDPYAKRYHDWWTGQMLARVKTDGRILDNGCGVGLLHERLPAERIVGLDISREMLRHAAEHYDQLVLGDSQALPFRGGSFDVVFCRSLLHHVPEPARVTAEIRRVLRPGGETVLVDTNTSVLSALPRWLARRGEHFSEDHKNLSRRVIERLLAPHFVVDDVFYFGYIAYPLLGFPDLVRVFRYVPFKPTAARALMAVDAVLSHVPLARTQSWGILVKATARPEMQGHAA